MLERRQQIRFRLHCARQQPIFSIQNLQQSYKNKLTASSIHIIVLTILKEQLIFNMEQDATQWDTLKKKVKTEHQPLACLVENRCGFARTLSIKLPHGEVLTPVYMPVGTKGAMKGITCKQMEQLDCRIMLSNTYHLGTKPGAQFVGEVGGLHKFMSWKRNILTDSGGFQMVSLSKLCQITEQGVKFESPYDKSEIFIRPQDSINFQNQIGSDIMMALDDVVKTTTVGIRMATAMERTLRWIDRNLAANRNPDRQTLFPIIQGGVDPGLRQICLKQIIKKNTSGYAIGGLSGGQAKKDFFRTIRQCCQALPENKPRYLMGVGYPVDLALGVALGVDMFDCVYPTRTARFGTAFTSYGEIKLRSKEYSKDFSALEENCKCETCSNFTRAYLYTTQSHDNFCHLLSIHNIHFLFELMRKLRKAIQKEELAIFLQTFLNNIYSRQKEIPDWVEYALQQAQIDIKLKHPYVPSKDYVYQPNQEIKEYLAQHQ